MTEGWDPPPMDWKEREEDWPQQYHLRFTPVGLQRARHLGVVMAPSHGHLSQAEVIPGIDGDVETAQIGSDNVRIHPPGERQLAELLVDGVPYVINDEGIKFGNATAQ